MSVRIPAIAAGALFATILATTAAHGATARISPAVERTPGVLTATATLMAHPKDACRMVVQSALFDVGPRDLLPRIAWRGRRVPLTACQRVYEDGSALGWVGLRVPAFHAPGHHYTIALTVWSHPRGALETAIFGSVRHTYIRSVW